MLAHLLLLVPSVWAGLDEASPEQILKEFRRRSSTDGGSRVVSYPQGCKLGDAYNQNTRYCIDTRALDVPAHCASSSPSNENCVKISPGGTVNWRIYTRKITKESEMSSLLNVVVSAEGPGWGSTASASAAYVSSHSSTDKWVGFYVGIAGDLYRKEFQTPHKMKLTASAKAILETSYANFIQIFGTHYVNEIIYSTSFIGSTTVKARSKEGSRGVEAAAKLSWQDMISVESSLEDTSSWKNSDTEVVTAYNYNGELLDPLPNSATPSTDLQARFDQFQSKAQAEPEKMGKASKIVYRSWLSSDEVLLTLVTTYPEQLSTILKLFNGGTPSQETLRQITGEWIWTNAEWNTLDLYRHWSCSNSTLDDQITQAIASIAGHMTQMDAGLTQHKLMEIEGQIIAGNRSWFIGENKQYSREIKGVLDQCVAPAPPPLVNTEDRRDGKFFSIVPGGCCCPVDDAILTVEECWVAVQKLTVSGGSTMSKNVVTDVNKPTGCSALWPTGSTSTTVAGYFNSKDHTDLANSVYSPVCYNACDTQFPKRDNTKCSINESYQGACCKAGAGGCSSSASSCETSCRSVDGIFSQSGNDFVCQMAPVKVKKSGNYYSLRYGAKQCRDIDMIKHEGDCAAAVKELGGVTPKRWEGTYITYPVGCSANWADSREVFNHAQLGSSRADKAPVCMHGGPGSDILKTAGNFYIMSKGANGCRGADKIKNKRDCFDALKALGANWGEAGTTSSTSTYSCATGSLEVHKPSSGHGDVCRNQGKAWTCPIGCDQVAGAPFCVWEGTSTKCHESTPSKPTGCSVSGGGNPWAWSGSIVGLFNYKDVGAGHSSQYPVCKVGGTSNAYRNSQADIQPSTLLQGKTGWTQCYEDGQCRGILPREGGGGHRDDCIKLECMQAGMTWSGHHHDCGSWKFKGQCRPYAYPTLTSDLDFGTMGWTQCYEDKECRGILSDEGVKRDHCIQEECRQKGMGWFGKWHDCGSWRFKGKCYKYGRRLQTDETPGSPLQFSTPRTPEELEMRKHEQYFSEEE